MKNEDIRWEQRFQNFEKAFFRLKESLEIVNPTDLERNGIVQRFEFTLELGWKTLKDYLQHEGLEFQLTPKGTFRQAQQSGLIDYGQVLIDALEVRNELAHDYDGDKFEKGEKSIRKVIFPALTSLHHFFKDQLEKNQMNLF